MGGGSRRPKTPGELGPRAVVMSPHRQGVQEAPRLQGNWALEL